MIERVRLKRWRIFDDVEITFGTGTTFVVAPNAAGKTSLLLGMAWAVYGEYSAVNAAECVRAGSTTAEAEVILGLPGVGRLEIYRTVPIKGRAKVAYVLDGESLAPNAAELVLEEAFGVRLSIASQLSMMLGGGHLATEKDLDLKGHLYEAFGVAGLRTSAARAAEVAKAVTKQRSSLRAASQDWLEDRGDKMRELADLKVELHNLERQRAELTAALAEITARRELTKSWLLHDRAIAAREAAVAEVMGLVQSILPGQVDPDALLDAIQEAATLTRAKMQVVSDHVTDARARRLAATGALNLLGDDDPSCPTCLRPFHGEELDSVRQTHQEALIAAEEAETRWQDSLRDHQQHLAQLDKLRDAVLGLPQPPIPPMEAPMNDGSDYDSALAALQDHDTQVGRLKHQIDGIAGALRSDDEHREALELEQRSYRHEAIAKVAAEALNYAAEQTSRRHIEPLAQEVQWRWKKLFGEGGLQLKADGAIVRVVGDRELSSATLSGGERIWARLVTHLLVLAASTQLPFAWFDEPLEHLDPRARRAVAASLATATQAGGPAQLIVTTYEHAIARQLAADLPGTSIIRLRRSGGG